ncbi:MAG: hypothetical protein IIZ25_02545, partial [Thermoguttaceae bacterium]|nr:hypothetical protein [Thermoguttaceae bacterium]
MKPITTTILSAAFLALCVFSSPAAPRAETIPADHGIPGWDELTAPEKSGTAENPAVIDIPKGIYHFDSEKCRRETNYYSNSLLTNPKTVALAVRNLNNAVIDFHDSELLGYGL